MSDFKILGYPIFTGDLNSIKTDQKSLINTLNQYSYCVAKKDPDFKEALQKSDILLPDGIGITLISKMLYNRSIKKIAGADMHQYLLTSLQKTGGSCFYLGASDNTLAKIKTRVSKEYPNIKVYSYAPPFKPVFTEEDSAEMIKQINLEKPDVLFVGMTAPKQEKWSLKYKDKLDTNVICSIGAVFDFYAGTVARPNQVWINLGLEWFIRLVKEPKRMWRRYLYYGPAFLWFVVKDRQAEKALVN